jgi:hypothetical protein
MFRRQATWFESLVLSMRMGVRPTRVGAAAIVMLGWLPVIDATTADAPLTRDTPIAHAFATKAAK